MFKKNRNNLGSKLRNVERRGTLIRKISCLQCRFLLIPNLNLYRKLDFNLLLLKVVYCQTRTDLFRGFLRHLKSLSDTCLKIFKNGKTQVPLFLHDVKTHDKNVSLCDNIPNRSQFFLLTLELSLISKTCSLSIQCMKTLWTHPVLSVVYISTIQ